MSTAETWDSYHEALILMLNRYNPRRCIEWGSGKSTITLAEHYSVISVDSVEHNSDYLLKDVSKKINVIYEPKISIYPFTTGRYDHYDFAFVDGIERVKCLQTSKDYADIVMLHDAERAEYQGMIKSFKYISWFDCGHTVVMSDMWDLGIF